MPGHLSGDMVFRRRDCFRDRENKQMFVWGWWTEEGEEINHDLCGEFEGARGMVHGLIRIIAHDERVRGERF